MAESRPDGARNVRARDCSRASPSRVSQQSSTAVVWVVLAISTSPLLVVLNGFTPARTLPPPVSLVWLL